MALGVSEEYRVPEVLLHVRKVRAQSASPSELAARISPSGLYQMCQAESDSRLIATALYQHASIECGFVLDGPNGKVYGVCPICGFVF